MTDELTKEEKKRIKEERRKAFLAAHPELAAKQAEANAKKKKLDQKKEEVAAKVGAAVLNDQQEARIKKMNDLRAHNIDPFGHAYARTAESGDIRKEYGDNSAEDLEKMKPEVSIAGRIMS